MSMAVSAATDLGLRRAQNEDNLGIWFGGTPREAARGLLLVVADGMGGARGGEIASDIAVRTVLETYSERPGSDLLRDLAESVEAANHAVHEHGVSNPELGGMGTTCTAVVIRGADVFVVHVGDSRLYRLRGGEIQQVTRDHSLVAQLVESRQITPDQARTDPRRNLVTRSVGVSATVEVDAQRLTQPLERGDTLLLSSDGLHGLVMDDDLARIASSKDLKSASRELIALARERGGYDNITVILARFEHAGETHDIAPIIGLKSGLHPETEAPGVPPQRPIGG